MYFKLLNIALCALLAAGCDANSQATAQDIPSPIADTTVTGTTDPSQELGERCEECRYDAQIVRIYDGDTFHVIWQGLPPELNPLGIRIKGIDTPELRGKCDAEKILAQAAKLYSESWLEQSAGYVRIGDLEWDKYGGRVDADVYVGPNQESLGQLLIDNGYARPYTGGKRSGWC